ncbi:hypothetical protein CUU66_20385 [Peribacillus deserti]|uniref:Uncharacterized protein n=1 Tax=Peribacillus deserti TaxID=673318 RepID=A0A2N5M159_9BACI|nr:hypothetical protein CUU66_20385 [Peribacillus deserti]
MITGCASKPLRRAFSVDDRIIGLFTRHAVCIMFPIIIESKVALKFTAEGRPRINSLNKPSKIGKRTSFFTQIVLKMEKADQ